MFGLFEKKGPRTWWEGGVFYWSIESKKAPLSLPWGCVYDPKRVRVSTKDPNAPHKCHALTGTWDGRLFLIVVPRTGEYVEIPEPGSVWTRNKNDLYSWHQTCSHLDPQGRAIAPFKRGDQ